ncbi:MAG: baseplate J/gp47 family protein [Clostridia bacterium]|nr:baseplate J/gp47 family protein [Clostridia bacterium]
MSLYEDRTYENLMEEALSRVDDMYDKREGSMIFNGNAPCLAEMAQVYIAIDFLLNSFYLHSAPREYLIKRAADHQIYPEAATAAVFKAEFNIDVPAGTRFSVDDLNFFVKEKLETEEEKEGVVTYAVGCETKGRLANSYAGRMIAIEYVDGLSSAELIECIIPGEDEEETEKFRKRVLEELKSIAFGGNRADYKQWVHVHCDGVKAVKVYPVWNEDINPASLIPSKAVTAWYEGIIGTISDTEVKTWLTAVYTAAILKKLTVGGTVKLVIMGEDNTTTPELIKSVQETIDPVEAAGEGKGIAPIGHVVSVYGVEEDMITITTNISCKNCKFDDIKADVLKVVNDYFEELKAQWENSENLIIRIAHVESRILSELSAYVEDITGTLIQGEAENYRLKTDYIPVLGDVVNIGG